MGHFFSHLARNQKREKCAGLNTTQKFFFLIQITWHPVSRDVGNVKNKSESLPLKVDIDSEPIKKLSKSEEKSKNLMAQWLSKGSSAKKSANDKNDDKIESPDEKRIKKE